MAKTPPSSPDAVASESDAQQKQAIVRRLRRIEGQVRGIEQMVDTDRDTNDVLTQVNAATAGLRAVARESLRRHVRQRLHEVDAEAGSRVGPVVESLLDDYHRQLR